jgi:hypothetical protein
VFSFLFFATRSSAGQLAVEKEGHSVGGCASARLRMRRPVELVVVAWQVKCRLEERRSVCSGVKWFSSFAVDEARLRLGFAVTSRAFALYFLGAKITHSRNETVAADERTTAMATNGWFKRRRLLR